MTITLQLPHAGVAGPSRPSPNRTFGDIEASYNVRDSLAEVVQAVRAARRIVVISGAGVSTAAQIPDFRSAQGLFATTADQDGAGTRRSMRGKGKLRDPLPLVRGKQPAVRDLFHVKSLADEELLPAHNHLLNSLFEVCDEARPTSFHTYLSTLDRRGQLLRCYTQNIDGLEEKAGLEVGLPNPLDRPGTKRRRMGVPPTPESRCSTQGLEGLVIPSTTPGRTSHPSPSYPLTPESSTEGSPPRTTSNPYPRVIPLHGTLSTLSCTFCSHSVSFHSVHPLPTYHLPCPACAQISSERYANSARQRSQGVLRPSVVLYGEDHPQGHLIGRVVERDLKGLGGKAEKEGKMDFLIVAGTSLSIPGIKRMVKEMSKVLADKPGVRTMYVNDDAPAQPKEWEGVFDVWVKGDIQHFVDHYLDNPNFAHRPLALTPPKTPRKRAAMNQTPSLSLSRSENTTKSGNSKRKRSPDASQSASEEELVTPSRPTILRIKLTLSSAKPATVPIRTTSTVPPQPTIPARFWKTGSPTPHGNRGRSPSLTPLSDEEDGDVVGQRVIIVDSP